MVKDEKDNYSFQDLLRLVVNLFAHLGVFLVYIASAWALDALSRFLLPDSQPISYAFRIVQQILVAGGLLVLVSGILRDIRSTLRKKE